MNNLNPKFDGQKKQARFNRANNKDLANPGLPFIQTFKEGIREYGKYAEIEKQEEQKRLQKGGSAGEDGHLPQIGSYSRGQRNQLGLNKGSLRAAMQKRQREKQTDERINQRMKNFYGSRLDDKVTTIRPWM